MKSLYLSHIYHFGYRVDIIQHRTQWNHHCGTQNHNETQNAQHKFQNTFVKVNGS